MWRFGCPTLYPSSPMWRFGRPILYQSSVGGVGVTPLHYWHMWRWQCDVSREPHLGSDVWRFGRPMRLGDLGVPSDVEIWVSHLVSVKRWRLGVSPQHSWGVRCAEIWATHKARRFGCAVRSNVRPMSGDLDAHKARRFGRTIRCGDLGVPACISQALEVWA